MLSKTVTLVVALALLTSLAVVVAPNYVNAEDNASDEVCKSIGGCVDDEGKNLGEESIQGVVKTIINVISAIAGIIAVIMIVVGGLKFVTAGGSSESVSSAKNTIIYAIVGLIVIAFAQAIVRFVLQTV